jgi:uncharacterized glyoxalase superfamily protein PhnB
MWRYSFASGSRRLNPGFTGCSLKIIDASYQELESPGANIVGPLKKKPWGLRQFTVEDLDGNLFYLHHD